MICQVAIRCVLPWKDCNVIGYVLYSPKNYVGKLWSFHFDRKPLNCCLIIRKLWSQESGLKQLALLSSLFLFFFIILLHLLHSAILLLSKSVQWLTDHMHAQTILQKWRYIRTIICLYLCVCVCVQVLECFNPGTLQSQRKQVHHLCWWELAW